MSAEIKIGIVEDELLIAEKIKRILLSVGYLVCEPVSSFDEALSVITKEKPDMMLLDVNLNAKKDGIDLADEINKKFGIPFIFLTANSDGATIERAKKVKPAAFLVKPFQKEELFASIEIAFNNYIALKAAQPPSPAVTNDFIFIRDAHRFVKVLFDNIIYVESRENYVVIHTKDKASHIIRSTFNDFIAQLPQEKFCRTHRGFIVRLSAIENVEPTEVLLTTGVKVPVSNTYKAALFSALGIKE